MMCQTPDEWCKVWNQRPIKASVVHRCEECYLPIPVGTVHLRTDALLDGWTTYRTHAECEALKKFVLEKICRVEHDRETAHSRYPSYFDGQILMGGLAEEITDIREYSWPVLKEEEDDVKALGFDVEKDEDDEGYTAAHSPVHVVTWLWDCIKAQYAALV